MALASYLQNFSKIGDKNFFNIEGSPLWIFQKIHDFLNDVRGKGGAGHTSSCLDATKIGLNLTLNMVIRVASPPLPLAMLTYKVRSVGGGPWPPLEFSETCNFTLFCQKKEA